MLMGSMVLLGVVSSGLCAASEAPPEGAVLLWPGDPPASAVSDGFRPYLEPYLIDSGGARGAVVVLPGGGYVGRADHEAEPIARRMNEAGFHAFVVHYRVAPHRHPAPLLDASRAMRIVRSRAAEWRVRPDRVALLGFSAGGHVAGTVGVHGSPGDPEAEDVLERLPSRPDALILCYALVTTGEHGHAGCFETLLGPSAPRDLWEWMSLECHVDADTPPTFLWHTANDEVVSVENSLLFAQALRAHEVPFELHVYPKGRHGLALSAEDPHVGTWVDLCRAWLVQMGW